MRRARLSFALLVLALSSASGLAAQICSGQPSLQTYRGNITLTGELQEDAKVYAAGINLGTRSFFGGIGGGLVVAEDQLGVHLGSAPLISGTFGYQAGLGPDGRIQVCPFFTGAKAFGPKNVEVGPDEFDFSAHSLLGGLSIGSLVATSGSLSVIPTGTVALVHTQSKSTDGAGTETTGSDTYVQVTAGAGLLFSEGLSLQPFVGVSVSRDNNQMSFGLRLSVAFGRRR